MTSERIQRQIERLLDQAEEAISTGDWSAARMHAQSVLALDESNTDAQAYIAAADKAGVSADPGETRQPSAEATTPPPSLPQPTSFAGGRYTVTKFLGEGGKKRVYLAQDMTLDRDVAGSICPRGR